MIYTEKNNKKIISYSFEFVIIQFIFMKIYRNKNAQALRPHLVIY